MTTEYYPLPIAPHVRQDAAVFTRIIQEIPPALRQRAHIFTWYDEYKHAKTGQRILIVKLDRLARFQAVPQKIS
jgi:hypothetical protein